MKAISTTCKQGAAIALALLFLGTLLMSLTDAQVIRRNRNDTPAPVVTPTQPATPATQPVQPQPTVAAPAPPTDRRDTVRTDDAVRTDDTARTDVTVEKSRSRILRSNQLIGLHIWDADHKQIGVVKEFFIVSQDTGCPAIYVATTFDESTSGGYVVVPFNILQLQYDKGRRSNYLYTEVSVNELRNAPRIRGNDWDAIYSPSFVSSADQFYHRIERTAARPGREGTFDGRNIRNDNQDQRRDNMNRDNTPPLRDPRLRNHNSDQGTENSQDRDNGASSRENRDTNEKGTRDQNNPRSGDVSPPPRMNKGGMPRNPASGTQNPNSSGNAIPSTNPAPSAPPSPTSPGGSTSPIPPSSPSGSKTPPPPKDEGSPTSPTSPSSPSSPN